MNKQYKFRKQWEAIANELGMADKAHHVAVTDPVTKKDSMILINNHRRFVRGMCELSLSEQAEKLVAFKTQMAELKAANAEVKASTEKELQGLVTKPEETK